MWSLFRFGYGLANTAFLTFPKLFTMANRQSLQQVLMCLQNLQSIAEDVFLKIGGRVNEEKLKIRNVGNRLESAKNKIISLSEKSSEVACSCDKRMNDRQAVLVSSASQFPGAEPKSYQAIFKDGNFKNAEMPAKFATSSPISEVPQEITEEDIMSLGFREHGSLRFEVRDSLDRFSFK